MAGVLDVFTFLFKSDTSQISDGVSDATNHAAKLDKEVESATKSMDKLGNKTSEAAQETLSLEQAMRSAAKWFGGYVAVSEVFSQFKEAVDAADHLDEFSESIEGNVEVLDAWGNAVKMNGGDMESFKMSMGSLAKAQADLAAKGRSRLTPFFEELGIKLTDTTGKAKSAIDLLPEIADAFEKIPKAQSLAFGERLGLDAGTVRLLQAGRAEIDKLIERQKKLGVITASQAKVSADFNDALDDTSHAFRSVYLVVAEAVLPILTDLLGGVQDIIIFMRENQGFAAGFFSVLAGVITYAFLPAILAATAATWAFIAPWLPLILLVAAVAAVAGAVGLLINDFMVWRDGGKSVIGDLVGSFDSFKKKVNETMDDVGSTIDSAIEKVKALWDALLHPLDTLSKLKDALLGALSPIMDAMPSLETVMGAGKTILGSISTPLTGLSSAAMGVAGTTNSNSVSVGKIEVHTQAQDAEGISRSIDGALKRQLLQTTQTFDDGVAY